MSKVIGSIPIGKVFYLLALKFKINSDLFIFLNYIVKILIFVFFTIFLMGRLIGYKNNDFFYVF